MILVSICNTRLFRAMTASALFVFGMGRGNYAHFADTTIL
jgi:hypothetical protein